MLTHPSDKATAHFPILMEDVMEYEEKMMKGEDDSEWSGDTVLSDIGEMEAESLGLYWEEVLREKMETSPEMWFFVSPMQRCLQTIDPLIELSLSEELHPIRPALSIKPNGLVAHYPKVGSKIGQSNARASADCPSTIGLGKTF